MFHLHVGEPGEVSSFANNSTLPQLPIKLKAPVTAERLLTPKDRSRGTYKRIHGWDETPRLFSPPRTADMLCTTVGRSKRPGLSSGNGSRSRYSHLNFNPIIPGTKKSKDTEVQLKDTEVLSQLA